MKKNIFGKCYQFSSEAEFEPLLAESLELYIDSEKSVVDVEVHIASKLPVTHPVSINPKLHQKFQNGMLTAYGNADIVWTKSSDSPLKVTLVLKKPAPVKRQIIKLLSMEFSRDVEIFEQVLHELVFIPSTYFFNDLALVHAAALSVNDKAILLAGTGGVGKSSALLALRNEPNVEFISDDISVISADGNIFGNMAWPKIYGYNCVGSKLKYEILAGRGLIDRLHFEIKNWLNPSKVRRKLKPNQLYKHVQANAAPISQLYYMCREDVKEMTVQEWPLDLVIDMNFAVMNTEYAMFHNHLHWELYNALVVGQKPMLEIKDVERHWRSVYANSLASVKRYKVSIPFEFDHIEYQQRIKGIVTGNLG